MNDYSSNRKKLKADLHNIQDDISQRPAFRKTFCHYHFQDLLVLGTEALYNSNKKMKFYLVHSITHVFMLDEGQNNKINPNPQISAISSLSPVLRFLWSLPISRCERRQLQISAGVGKGVGEGGGGKRGQEPPTGVSFQIFEHP